MNPRAKAWMKQNKEINVKGRTTTTTPLCWLDITQNVMPKSFSARPLAYLAAPLGPLACLSAAVGPLDCLAAALGPLAWLT